MRGAVLGIAALIGACNASIGGAVDPANPDAGDDTVDADTTDAPLGNFSAPVKITTAADATLQEDDGTLSYSGLELVFAVVNANDANRKDLFYASRGSLADTFGAVTILPFSAIGTSEETPRFTADDKTLFFAKTNGTNGLDIFTVSHPAPGAMSWGTPALVAGVNSTNTDKWLMPCGGSHYLMIVGGDIAEGTLGGGAPVIVPELSSVDSETGPFMTQDCLTAHFASTRNGGTNRLYESARAAVDQPWSTPVVVDTFAALGGNQEDPFISTDQRTFVFASDAGGTKDLYISTR